MPYPSLPGKNSLTEDFRISIMSAVNNNKEVINLKIFSIKMQKKFKKKRQHQNQ